MADDLDFDAVEQLLDNAETWLMGTSMVCGSAAAAPFYTYIGMRAVSQERVIFSCKWK